MTFFSNFLRDLPVYLLSLPVGASVVAASLIAFLLAAAAGRLRRK